MRNFVAKKKKKNKAERKWMRHCFSSVSLLLVLLFWRNHIYQTHTSCSHRYRMLSQYPILVELLERFVRQTRVLALDCEARPTRLCPTC